jgi:hypothetical protein
MKRREGIAYLTTDPDTGEDTGGLYVPCSRYGRNSADCAPVAWRVAHLVARETGEEITTESLDYAMGLVVNDHDDVAYLIRNYGHGHYV